MYTIVIKWEERKDPEMTNANTVESILNKVAAGFTVFSVNFFTRNGQSVGNDWAFDSVEEAIAAYGDEEVCKWKLESVFGGKVRVTINL